MPSPTSATPTCPRPVGKSIPLTQIAKPVFTWEPGVMWREGRDYAITVQSDIVEGLQGATVTNELLPKLRRWRRNGPRGQAGYRIEVAGAVEESSKGSASIAAGCSHHAVHHLHPADAAVAQLQPRHAGVPDRPTGHCRCGGALLVLGRPFGFVALLGVIALMGMIQRNSVILIDQIEQDRANGVPAWDAIVESAVRRLRPIVLTAAAAVLAMIPLSRSVFWGPMAVAIMGGLIVATVLTLLALPAMYAAWFRVKREKVAEAAGQAVARSRLKSAGLTEFRRAARSGAALQAPLLFSDRAGGEIGRRTRFRS
jgi:multidrug efflux pump